MIVIQRETPSLQELIDEAVGNYAAVLLAQQNGEVVGADELSKAAAAAVIASCIDYQNTNPEARSLRGWFLPLELKLSEQGIHETMTRRKRWAQLASVSANVHLVGAPDLSEYELLDAYVNGNKRVIIGPQL